jgi:hypothetical protein
VDGHPFFQVIEKIETENNNLGFVHDQNRKTREPRFKHIIGFGAKGKREPEKFIGVDQVQFQIL